MSARKALPANILPINGADAEIAFHPIVSMGILYNAGDSYLQDCKTHWGFIKHSILIAIRRMVYNTLRCHRPKRNRMECTYHVVPSACLFCRNWLLAPEGWVNPLATNARQGEKSQALKMRRSSIKRIILWS